MSDLEKRKNLSRAFADRVAPHLGDDTDLETMGKLFSDIGIKILGGGEAHKFVEQPFLSGVISKAYVKIQEDDGREQATFVIDVVDSVGEIHNVYCNSNLCMKIWSELGHPLQNLQWRRFEGETRHGGPDRDTFIAQLHEAARELELFWIGILYMGKKESRNGTGRSYNDFQAVMAPKEVTQNGAMLEAIESALRPGKNHLRQRDEDGGAIPEFVDSDI